MKRVIVMIVALSLVLLVGGDTADAQTGGPALTVENPRIDLGLIKAGATATGTFVFHNSGDKDVKIIKAKPS